MPSLRSVLRRAVRAPSYAALWSYSLLRTSRPVWPLLNREGRALFERETPTLTAVQRRILADLERDGLAVSHLDELLPEGGVTTTLIEHAQAALATANTGVRKSFLQYAWGDLYADAPMLDLRNPFIRTSLDRRIVDVVNSYIGVCSKFVYFELGQTTVMPANADRLGSQRWHRDPGMKRIVKTFFYLTDVDDGSGPFSYVLGSHRSGRWGGFYPQKQFGRRGMYPPDKAVERSVPARDIRACTAPAGSVIFCDTTGLHLGGYSVTRPRIMYTGVYVAPADVIKPKFRRAPEFAPALESLDPVSRFTLA